MAPMWGFLAVRPSGYPLIDARGNGEGEAVYIVGGAARAGDAFASLLSGGVFRGNVYREMVVAGSPGS